MVLLVPERLHSSSPLSPSTQSESTKYLLSTVEIKQNNTCHITHFHEVSILMKTELTNEFDFSLSQEQISDFLTDGVLVVENVFTEDEINEARLGLRSTLMKYGIDTTRLQETGGNLKHLSSTNGSGGVLDIFYPEWKFKMMFNPKFFSVISQLWDVSFHHQDNNNFLGDKGNVDNDDFKRHPFGPFDTSRGYVYIDRIGYRIPTKIAECLGNSGRKSKKKSRPIQRSLTPHLDCCPTTILNDYYFNQDKSYGENNNGSNNDPTGKMPPSKWRPLQSFISLTDNLEPSTGGFEAVKGFHRKFDHWARYERKPSVNPSTGEISSSSHPCVGEFTPIRPKEDKDVLSQVTHIPCKKGSVVIWDNRIPHANSWKNNSDQTREVVYASFLPDVDINRKYAEKQLCDYESGLIPRDQWIEVGENNKNKTSPFERESQYSFSSLFERKLMSIDKW